jgi:hypothetical protein
MDPLPLITAGGAAGMAAWVLHLLVSNKLQTHSEVEGLRADKRELFAANKVLTEANNKTQEALREILKLLQEEDDE